MRIKLDENLPEALVAALTGSGHDVDNVRMEGLSGASDPEVWQAVQREGRFLITQDLDFSNIHRFSPGTHHGLMLVRLRLPGRLALAQKIVEALRHGDGGSFTGCFVLLTDAKLRIHRPK